MTDPEYLFKQTEIERKRIGRGDRNKKRGGGRYVRLPSDNMTKKEREAMNGEIKTYKVKEFYTWEEFKALPDDLQLKWVNSLINRFGCSVYSISTTVFGGARNRLYLHLTRKGLGEYINSAAKGYGSRKCQERLEQAFKAWNDTQVTDPNIIIEAKNDEVELQNDEVEKNVVEEAPEPPKSVTPAIYKLPEKPKAADLHNIALLLQSLSGTGAKLTIEVTL